MSSILNLSRAVPRLARSVDRIVATRCFVSGAHHHAHKHRMLVPGVGGVLGGHSNTLGGHRTMTMSVRQLEERIEELEEQLAAEKAKVERLRVPGVARQIGIVESCFRKRFGTPRQSSLVPSARGTVVVDRSVISATSLKGMEEFSHIWVMYLFHENTNVHKLRRPKNTRRGQTQFQSFPAMVHPPQAGGEKIGLFATRTPHRPSPIGLSLLTVLSVDSGMGLIHVKGLDLIDGTPVIDIKPFVPYADTPIGDTTFPSWITNDKFGNVPIRFTNGAHESLNKLAQQGALRAYKDESEVPELMQGIAQALYQDPRSLRDGRGKFDGKVDHVKPGPFYFHFDNLCVEFHVCCDESSNWFLVNKAYIPSKRRLKVQTEISDEK